VHDIVIYWMPMLIFHKGNRRWQIKRRCTPPKSRNGDIAMSMSTKIILDMSEVFHSPCWRFWRLQIIVTEDPGPVNDAVHENNPFRLCQWCYNRIG